MQARDTEILNQEEVVTVGNKEQFRCRALRTTTTNHEDLAVVGMGQEERRVWRA